MSLSVGVSFLLNHALSPGLAPGPPLMKIRARFVSWVVSESQTFNKTMPCKERIYGNIEVCIAEFNLAYTGVDQNPLIFN